MPQGVFYGFERAAVAVDSTSPSAGRITKEHEGYPGHLGITQKLITERFQRYFKENLEPMRETIATALDNGGTISIPFYGAEDYKLAHARENFGIRDFFKQLASDGLTAKVQDVINTVDGRNTRQEIIIKIEKANTPALAN